MNSRCRTTPFGDVATRVHTTRARYHIAFPVLDSRGACIYKVVGRGIHVS